MILHFQLNRGKELELTVMFSLDSLFVASFMFCAFECLADAVQGLCLQSPWLQFPRPLFLRQFDLTNLSCTCSLSYQTSNLSELRVPNMECVVANVHGH